VKTKTHLPRSRAESPPSIFPGSLPPPSPCHTRTLIPDPHRGSTHCQGRTAAVPSPTLIRTVTTRMDLMSSGGSKVGGTAASGHPHRSRTSSRDHLKRGCPPLPRLFPRHRGRNVTSQVVGGRARAVPALVFRWRLVYRNMSMNMRMERARGMKNVRPWLHARQGQYVRRLGVGGILAIPRLTTPRATTR
jgi:hypothetical protein